ncbi:EVE domain-containing protein [Flavobacterium filum]|uniref:EVE domain-containing protein n=1 Tax=Flavobacterium filum TaxID=370974 RepID=UPI0023F2DD3F|nr:EVE domain-containing protein [Flavobacterium filum]
MRYWAIHLNPENWNYRRDLTENNTGMYKITLKHKSLIKKGDKGILWVSGELAGVYSIVDILSNPYISIYKYGILKKYAFKKSKFIGEHIVIDIAFSKKLLSNPISRYNILQNNLLNNLHAFINPQGLNTFELTEEQYKEILRMVDESGKR